MPFHKVLPWWNKNKGESGQTFQVTVSLIDSLDMVISTSELYRLRETKNKCALDVTLVARLHEQFLAC